MYAHRPAFHLIMLLHSGATNLLQYVTSLGQYQEALRACGQKALPSPASQNPPLTWQPDTHRILGRCCPTSQMSPTWKGPFTVSLCTPTAFKVPGVSSWTHHSRIKPWKGEEGEDLPTGSQSSCEVVEDLKLLFKKVPLSTDD